MLRCFQKTRETGELAFEEFATFQPEIELAEGLAMMLALVTVSRHLWRRFYSSVEFGCQVVFDMTFELGAGLAGRPIPFDSFVAINRTVL